MLELKHISKIYNPGLVTEMCLFDDFNFTVNDGEFVSVIGSNGSGKTSMLNIICGSIPVNAGEVLINGKCVNKKKDFERYAYIGRVYQNPSMGNCPNMTILENMSLKESPSVCHLRSIKNVMIFTANSFRRSVSDLRINCM